MLKLRTTEARALATRGTGDVARVASSLLITYANDEPFTYASLDALMCSIVPGQTVESRNKITALLVTERDVCDMVSESCATNRASIDATANAGTGIFPPYKTILAMLKDDAHFVAYGRDVHDATSRVFHHTGDFREVRSAGLQLHDIGGLQAMQTALHVLLHHVPCHRDEMWIRAVYRISLHWWDGVGSYVA